MQTVIGTVWAIIQPLLFDHPVDLPRDVYASLLDREPLYGVPLLGYRCAIDSPERYIEAQDDMATGRYQG